MTWQTEVMAREQRGVSGGTELGRFLRAHRTRVTPEEAGLPLRPGLRRTPGLRREELATLAGVSIDYYTRLERGKETNPSASVVDALARVLKLDTAEHGHLRDLVACGVRRAVAEPVGELGRSVRPGVELLLDNLRPCPAYVVSRTMDIIACNPSGLRLFAGMGDWPADKRNVVRYVFLHPQARTLFDDWDEQIRACVGRLRALAGTEPDAPDLAELVSELHSKSPEFTDLWDRYDVRWHTHGSKTFRHPEVGDVTPGYQSMQIEGTVGQRFIAYYAEPGTPDHDKLVLLDMTSPKDISVRSPFSG
ncbi:transcriptional regulator with XRE-family HTH domain [Streptomyces pseudovenezuelae]|jgi:transcriptional regulator with XRE-family HTH domain|uniref:Transcriptional regulator with XRE-family HTH domain n=2 Tax=Streptomyces pseudovenezuelae TaxID=67350 RepID=A0ABT6LDG5_9ACTN|nr:transcriptional regulator with XRE-family HTH domain [Streptomyces pseudovenezuelae]